MSKESEAAASAIERDSAKYDENNTQLAVDIDKAPYYTPAMEKEEQRINAEADARAAAGTDADGQMALPGMEKEVSTKKEVEEEPYVRKAKIKLVLNVELEGDDKPMTVPLLIGEFPSDRVLELLHGALNTRRNKRRIEAALDLPEPEDEKEELFDRPVSETLAEGESKEESKSESVPATDGSNSAAVADASASADGEEQTPLEDSVVRETEEARDSDASSTDSEVQHVDTVDHEAEVKRGEQAF